MENLMGIHLWIVAIGSLLLLVASAFISGSEIAFFSLTPQDRQALEEAEDVPSKMVFDLLNTPDAERGARQLLATILVLNNTVNIVIILLSTVLMQHWLVALPPIIGTVLHVFGVTFLIVLFGEVLPKVYANRRSATRRRKCSTRCSLLASDICSSEPSILKAALPSRQ